VKSPKYGEKLSAKNIDWLGIALLIISIGSLQFILEKGQEEDWFNSNLITTLSVICFFGFYFFIWRELVYKHPIVELRVLRDRNLSIGSILSFVLGFGLFGSTFIIPLYTQTIMGWTALQAGMLMIPSTVFTALMMPLVGKLMERGTPMRFLISTGMVIFFIYSIMAYYVLTPNTGSDAFFWILVIRGVGLGLLSIPITTLALSTLKGQQIGQGAALSGMLRQLGGSFGVAIISTYLIRDNQKHRVDLLSNLSVTDPAVQQRVQMLTGGFHAKKLPLDFAKKSAEKLLNGMVDVQATILSYMDVFLWIGVMFLVCVPFVILFVKKTKRNVDLSHVAE
jgi:DHA2 family multidrug resistance protein